MMQSRQIGIVGTPRGSARSGGGAGTPGVVRRLAVIEGELERRKIQSMLGLHDEKHFREFYQQPVVALGLIEMTNPDKTDCRLQKYRITDAGRALLAGGRKS